MIQNDTITTDPITLSFVKQWRCEQATEENADAAPVWIGLDVLGFLGSLQVVRRQSLSDLIRVDSGCPGVKPASLLATCLSPGFLTAMICNDLQWSAMICNDLQWSAIYLEASSLTLMFVCGIFAKTRSLQVSLAALHLGLCTTLGRWLWMSWRLPFRGLARKLALQCSCTDKASKVPELCRNRLQLLEAPSHLQDGGTLTRKRREKTTFRASKMGTSSLCALFRWRHRTYHNTTTPYQYHKIINWSSWNAAQSQQSLPGKGRAASLNNKLKREASPCSAD